MKIAGYRELSPMEVALVNALKMQESAVLLQLEEVAKNLPEHDARSLAVARTQLQTAFMWANRAITRPEPVPVPGPDGPPFSAPREGGDA